MADKTYMPVIIYEDNHCLVVNKPWNMLVQPDDTGDISLYAWAQEWVKKKSRKQGNVYIGIVHRLDRPAGGIVLLARTSKAASRFSNQFREGRVGKHYLVVVEGDPGPPGERIHYLRKNERLNRTRVSLVPGRGRRSRLTIKAVWRSGGLALLWIELDTGRSHQIRAQLSHERCPVVGDLRYGASGPLPGKHIALFSWRIVFEHPTRKITEVLTCPPPWDEYPWNEFRTQVDALPPVPENGMPQ